MPCDASDLLFLLFRGAAVFVPLQDFRLENQHYRFTTVIANTNRFVHVWLLHSKKFTDETIFLETIATDLFVNTTTNTFHKFSENVGGKLFLFEYSG